MGTAFRAGAPSLSGRHFPETGRQPDVLHRHRRGSSQPIFGPGQVRQETHQQVCADERAESHNGNRRQRGGEQRPEPSDEQRQDHDVRKVNAIAFQRDVLHQPSHAAFAPGLDMQEDREDAVGHHRDIDGAESPAEFQIRDHGGRLHPGAEDRCRDDVSHDGEEHGPGEGQRTVPADMESQQEITDEPAEIIEGRSRIPETLAPDLREDQMNIGDQRRNAPQPEIPLQFGFGAVRQPRGDHRHDQIEPDQHIDIPEMPDLHAEVDRDMEDIRDRLSPGIPAGGHIIEGIEDGPYDEGAENADKAFLEEFGAGPLHRQEQETRNHHEQRHGDPGDAGNDSDPEGVLTGNDASGLPDIEEFAGVLMDHQIAGQDPQQIQREIPIRFHHTLLEGVSQSGFAGIFLVHKAPGGLKDTKKGLTSQAFRGRISRRGFFQIASMPNHATFRAYTKTDFIAWRLFITQNSPVCRVPAHSDDSFAPEINKTRRTWNGQNL